MSLCGQQRVERFDPTFSECPSVIGYESLRDKEANLSSTILIHYPNESMGDSTGSEITYSVLTRDMAFKKGGVQAFVVQSEWQESSFSITSSWIV